MGAETQAELVTRLERDFATAVEALDHWAETTPGKIAVHDGESGVRLSFAEVGDLTDNLAANLMKIGVRRGEPVGVFSLQPLVAALAMYGAWKAGALYAPVNFQYEGDLLAYQLNDTRPAVLLIDDELRGRVDEVLPLLTFRPRLIGVAGRAGGEFASLLESDARPGRRPTWNEAANIIYTSGTTGPSKGVVQSHRWVNGYTWAGRIILTPDDVVYNDLPMYHVGGAHFNVAKALWAGASVSIWPRFSPTAFWDRIRAGACTSAVLLDVMTPWLLDAAPQPQDRRNSLNKVHMQPLSEQHHAFASRFGVDFITSGFGQSETGASLMALIDENTGEDGTPRDLYRGLSKAAIRRRFIANGLPVFQGDAPIPHRVMGKASPFMEVTVLDERDREVAPGNIGQLAMRPRVPSLVFDEYLAKPEATLAAWRNLWVHTGDAAVQTDDGTFCYVDRMSDRVRVRGENVSSFEVEEALAKHPSVRVAAVIGVPSAEGSEDTLVAYVEVAAGATFDAAALAGHCRARLPSFMQPQAFVAIAEIPKTATNKIEKYKLREQWKERN